MHILDLFLIVDTNIQYPNFFLEIRKVKLLFPFKQQYNCIKDHLIS